MCRILQVIMLCFLVGLVTGCSGHTQGNAPDQMDSFRYFKADTLEGWKPLETLPQRYAGLPGVEEGEEIVNILSNSEGSGIILFVRKKFPVPMYAFQKDVYDLMDQRGKTFKKNTDVKKYRCMHSYTEYDDLYGIDSYFEYWKVKDDQGAVKGVRRTYFVPRDETSIWSVSKVLYSDLDGYDTNLIAFSDIVMSESE